MASEITRRSLVAGAALVPAALVPVTALTATAQTTGAVFSAAQLRILTAFVDRIIPKDELGPSASESGVTEYISRSMGDYLAGEKARFIEGLEAMDAFARRSQDRPFADLSPEKQDAVLTAMEAGSAQGFANAQAFFNRARRLTLEGMFGDPYYGGNKNFAGWDLIRYPGPRLATSADDQKMGVDIKPLHRSAYSEHGH